MQPNPLKEARKRAGLSVRKAASGLGFSLTKLQTVEGEGTCPSFPPFDPARLSVADLEAMAALYGVSVSALLGREPLPAAPTSAA